MLFVVGEAGFVERIGEHEHDRVVASIVVRVDVRMSEACLLQHLILIEMSIVMRCIFIFIRKLPPNFIFFVGTYLNKDFRVVVFGERPVGEVALLCAVYRVDRFVHRLGRHKFSKVLVGAQLERVGKVHRLS